MAKIGHDAMVYSLCKMVNLGQKLKMPSTVENAEHSRVVVCKKPLQETLNIRKMSCLLYTSPSPRDGLLSRMPSSA